MMMIIKRPLLNFKKIIQSKPYAFVIKKQFSEDKRLFNERNTDLKERMP